MIIQTRLNGEEAVINSASYAVSASYSKQALSASYAPSIGGTSVSSASWVSASVHIINSDTASYALNAGLVQQVSCFPNGTYVFNGITYNPVGSSTCGIQEAINALPTASNYQTPGGGTIYFAPGIFYTSASIVSPNTRYPFGLQLYGAGINTTGIVMSGSNATGSVIEFGGGNFGALTGSCNDKSFHMKDMFVANAFNTTNSIVYVKGPGDNVSSSSIATAVIEHCWFGWWQAMITQDSNITHEGGVLTPSINDDAIFFGLIKHNLVGLRIDCNFNNNTIVRDCEFTFLAVGLDAAGDHLIIQDNVFSFCGRIHSVDNDWPWTSLNRIGAGVVLQESSNVGGLWNGNDNWRCSGNNFIGSSPSSSCYIFNSMRKFPRMVYGDSYEVDAGCGNIVTNGSPITIINPMLPDRISQLVNYKLPSTSDFSNWNSQPITATFSSSLIRTWDMNWDATYDGPFSFSGSITALHLTASVLGTASNAISASYAPGVSAATYTSSLFGTASWATNAIMSSYVSTHRAGTLSMNATSGMVSFTGPMTNTNYAVSMMGTTVPLIGPTVGGKSVNGFTASFASNFSGALDWIVIPYTQ
jgi:uncharacterized protein YlzI (FlbEa/FlbD family)